MKSHVGGANEGCAFRVLGKGLEWGSLMSNHFNILDS